MVHNVIDNWDDISAPAISEDTPVPNTERHALDHKPLPALPRDVSPKDLGQDSYNSEERSFSLDDPGEGSSSGQQVHGAPPGFRFSHEPPLPGSRELVSPFQPTSNDAVAIVPRRKVDFTLSPYPTPACASEIRDFNLQPDPQLGLSVKLLGMDESASNSPDPTYAPVFSDSDESLKASPTRTQSPVTHSVGTDSDRPSLIVRFKSPEQTDLPSTSSVVRTERDNGTDLSFFGVQTRDFFYDPTSVSTPDHSAQGIETSVSTLDLSQDIETSDRARRNADSQGTHVSDRDQDRRTDDQFRNMAALRHFVFGESPSQEYLTHLSDSRGFEETVAEAHYIRRSSSTSALISNENLPTTSRRSHFAPPLSQPERSEATGRIRDSVAGGKDEKEIDMEDDMLERERQRSLSY
jgi:hypothetical protein